MIMLSFMCFFFFKQKTAYEMRISDWSSDVCSSDLQILIAFADRNRHGGINGNVGRRRRAGVDVANLSDCSKDRMFSQVRSVIVPLRARKLAAAHEAFNAGTVLACPKRQVRSKRAVRLAAVVIVALVGRVDRKSTRLNSSH